MQQPNGKLAKHNPLTFYFRTLLNVLSALMLRVVTFAPLACLFAFPEQSPLRYLSILCPLLLIFLLLPLRFSFAEAMVQKYNHHFFSFTSPLNMHRYGEKLNESLLHAWNVVKWGIPIAAMLGVGYYYYVSVDILSLISAISDLGMSVTAAYCDFVNFFIHSFVGELTIAGSLMEGIYALLGIVGLGLLILLYGMMRNSAYRYIWATTTPEDHAPRVVARRYLRGRRFQQFKTALLNLICWIPFIAVLVATLGNVLGDLSTILLTGSSEQDLPNLAVVIWPLLLSFVFLYLPLLPVRRSRTALFACKRVGYAHPRSGGQENMSTDEPHVSKPDPSPSDPETEEASQAQTFENASAEPRTEMESSTFTLGQ